jgi:hypothetical protein
VAGAGAANLRTNRRPLRVCKGVQDHLGSDVLGGWMEKRPHRSLAHILAIL